MAYKYGTLRIIMLFAVAFYVSGLCPPLRLDVNSQFLAAVLTIGFLLFTLSWMGVVFAQSMRWKCASFVSLTATLSFVVASLYAHNENLGLEVHRLSVMIGMQFTTIGMYELIKVRDVECTRDEATSIGRGIWTEEIELTL